jgi:hypothetical protein
MNGLLITMAPWLAGSLVIGALAGRQSVENRKRNRIIARQQAAIDQLRKTSAELQAQLATTTTTSTRPTPSPPLTQIPASTAKEVTSPAATGDTRHALLQRVIENNLSLRNKIV